MTSIIDYPTHLYPTPVITPTVKTNSLGNAFLPKRSGKKTFHLVFVLDDSYSMLSTKKATISGYNEYLNGQRLAAKENGIPTFVSLYKFDGNDVKSIFSRISISEVQNLTESDYHPMGSTNLYDGIGGVMLQLNSDFSSKKKKDRDAVIITILTDGEENASRIFSQTDIKQMIEKAEAKNWGFMFLGANIDAFQVGSTLGFNANNTIQYDMKSLLNTMSVASAMTTRMVGSYASDMSTEEVYRTSAFTDEERKMAVSADAK